MTDPRETPQAVTVRFECPYQVCVWPKCHGLTQPLCYDAQRAAERQQVKIGTVSVCES